MTTSISLGSRAPKRNECNIRAFILNICSGAFGIFLATKSSFLLNSPYTSAETPILGAFDVFFFAINSSYEI